MSTQKKDSPAKQKKKSSPIGLILIICIFILMLANFPIGFVKYDMGSTEMWRVVTPLYTYIFPSLADLSETGSTPMPEPQFYFFPNNFKTYQELQELQP